MRIGIVDVTQLIHVRNDQASGFFISFQLHRICDDTYLYKVIVFVCVSVYNWACCYCEVSDVSVICQYKYVCVTALQDVCILIPLHSHYNIECMAL